MQTAPDSHETWDAATPPAHEKPAPPEADMCLICKYVTVSSDIRCRGCGAIKLAGRHRPVALPNPAATPQPPPQPGTTLVLGLVIQDLLERALMGAKKYGTPLMVENGRDALIDAYQESLDQALYLRQAITLQEKLWHTIAAVYDLATDAAKYPTKEAFVGIAALLAPLVNQRKAPDGTL